MKLFSRHYGTERFFIMIFLCIALLIGLGVYSGMIQAENNKTYVAETAIYTRTYSWSRMSTNTGSVAGMITNKDHTAVFLLLKNNDASAISYNAEDYQVFMTGRDQKLVNVPVLTTYVYGTTGYVGFYFKDARGFANMVYSLIIRNDSAASIAAGETQLGAAAQQDTSFRDHNQIRLYLNFGASGVDVNGILDEVALDPNGAPMRLVADMNLATAGDGTGVSARYDAACKTAQEHLTTMSTSLMQVTQYRENLASMSVVVPDVPYYMAGDRIDTVPNDFAEEVSVFDAGMISGGGSDGFATSIMGFGDSGQQQAQSGNDDDGEAPKKTGSTKPAATYVDNEGKTHEYYYLHTDVLYPGAVSLDWQGNRLSGGYVSRIGQFAEGTTSFSSMYSAYVEWRDGMKAQYGTAMSLNISYDAWRKIDGSYVDMNAAKTTPEGRIAEACTNYTDALNRYLQAKQSYFDTMAKIMDIEGDVYMLGQQMTANSGTKVQNLWLY